MNFQKKIILCLTIFCWAVFVTQQVCAKEPSKPSSSLFEGFIYYADDGLVALKSEKRKFASSLDDYGLGEQILNVLFQGPSLSGLAPVWPKETKLNALFITQAGICYVDLDIPRHLSEQMDTTSEMLAVYSLVNSLALNLEKVKQVKILIHGQQAHTLAGHIGLSDPYKPNMLIVK